MTVIEPIVVSTTANVTPDVALEIFVEKIGCWWRPGPDSWNDPARAIGVRFERGLGGLEFLSRPHSWPAGYAAAWQVLGERYGYTLL